MSKTICIAGMLLVAILSGCYASLPTRSYTATPPSPPPPIAIPLAPTEKAAVHVTVESIARSGDPEYKLPYAGYTQYGVVVRNPTELPIELSNTQFATGGVATRGLYSIEIVPIQNNSILVAGASVGSVLAGATPVVGIAISLGNRLFGNARNSTRKTLDSLMLPRGTVPPGTSVAGIVVFRDNGRNPETLFVNYFTGGPFSGDMKSVTVTLQQQEVAAAVTP